MPKVYILKLIDNKFYVGSSKNVENRFKQHLSGKGSRWTKKFTPLEIISIIPNTDKFDEDKYVKKFMNSYGIQSTRGGSYSSIVLPDFQLLSLRMELSTIQNRCFNCMEQGHFASECPEEKISFVICGRCKKLGHSREDCFSCEDSNGKLINDKCIMM